MEIVDPLFTITVDRLIPAFKIRFDALNFLRTPEHAGHAPIALRHLRR